MTRVYGDLRWNDLDRETELGLFLNLGREETRNSADTANGISIAFGSEPSLDYFRAIAIDEDEAIALQNLHAARMQCAKNVDRGGA